MSRVLVLLGCFFVLISALSLRDYSKFKVESKKFNFEENKQIFIAKEKIKNLKLKKKKKVRKVQPLEKKFILALDTEQLKRGHSLYAKCIVCHGKMGQGKKSQKSPAIGGQYDWYLQKQIFDMKSGVRKNAVMSPYIKKLTEKDIIDLSVYISKLPWKK